jgi:hypothetical protein
MKKLKKKIKFIKNSSLFLKNKLFFICLLSHYIDYSSISSEIILKGFKIHFLKNSFIHNLNLFSNVKEYLTGPIFSVLKKELEYKDYYIFNSILFKKGHIILFYLDNQFYSFIKLKNINNFFKNKFSVLSHLIYFYFLLKLNFILKLKKINILQGCV